MKKQFLCGMVAMSMTAALFTGCGKDKDDNTFVVGFDAEYPPFGYMDEKGKFHLSKADLITYSHGEYYGLGKLLGTFGYSVKKPVKKAAGKKKKSGASNKRK